ESSPSIYGLTYDASHLHPKTDKQYLYAGSFLAELREILPNQDGADREVAENKTEEHDVTEEEPEILPVNVEPSGAVEPEAAINSDMSPVEQSSTAYPVAVEGNELDMIENNLESNML
ncbi:hypothetical protein PHET_08197, partial [Paragonimus heterotremus]